jgi:hypothetical protein
MSNGEDEDENGSRVSIQRIREKRDHHRLIELTARHRDYSSGPEDELWWSRVMQPNLHTLAEKDEAGSAANNWRKTIEDREDRHSTGGEDA